MRDLRNSSGPYCLINLNAECHVEKGSRMSQQVSHFIGTGNLLGVFTVAASCTSEVGDSEALMSGVLHSTASVLH